MVLGLVVFGLSARNQSIFDPWELRGNFVEKGMREPANDAVFESFRGVSARFRRADAEKVPFKKEAGDLPATILKNFDEAKAAFKNDKQMFVRLALDDERLALRRPAMGHDFFYMRHLARRELGAH